MYLEQPYDEPGTLTGSYSNQKQQYASGASDMMNRPNRGRRSSSGVANDHGLASAAAMTAHSHATYKNDPPKTPISMRFVKARQSALTPPQSPTKDGGMKASLRSSPHTAASTEVLPPSPPQQSNKPESEDQSEESHFPKTLRHTAKQLKNALVNGRSEEERPIPLSLKSPRRSGKKSSSSGPSSYNKLADSTSLPVPPSNPKGATQNITPPQPNGPASAKSMRHPAVRDQPITSQQEQMIDPSSPIDKGKGKQRSSPLVNEVVAEEADTEIAQDDGILPTDSVTPSLEEGSFLSAKTLRHPKEVKQKKGENPIFSRIPLSGKTLRRPAEERRGSFFSRFKPNISRHTSNVSSEGPAPVGQNTETWVQETATMPAVVHEHVHPNIHYVEDQQIHRDTIDEQVNIHYLPVKAEPEFQLHESFVDEDGLTIMTKITRSDQPITLNKQQDRVLVSENMAATPGGSPRVETLYRDRSQLSGGVTPGTYGLPGNVGTNRVDWADDMNEAAACPTAMNALRDGDVFVSGPAPQTKASPHPAATGMGIPPPATQSHQPIHSTDRNDLGPTHHTDIDQRRPDDAYAGLDSEGYLGPGMHPETMREETATNQTAGLAGGIRRPSVTTEWSQVPKPKQAKMKRGEMSPVGERPSRPVPEAKKSLDSFRRKAKELKENVQQNLTRRLSGSKASQVSADATTAAGNVSQAAKDRVASVDTEQIKSGATSVMNNVEQTAQSARQQMPNAPSGNDIATAGARAIAGLKNMAGVTASEHVSTPQPPGAYDSEHYTQSEASDYGMSNHTNTSPSSSPRSQLSVKERELSRDNIEMIKNIDSRPTNQHMEHRVVPAGVIKGGRAILGPSELMLSRAEEEQLAAQKILHGGKMARGGITQGHHAMVAPGTLMLSREEEEKLAAQKLKQQRMAGASIAAKQAMNGQRLQQKMTNGRDTARKVAEEHRRETEREKVQAREIESIINQNVAKDRESTARMEKMKLDAESAKKEADRTQKKKDIQIAKNLKDAYESALAQNQRVLRETYRSGLGVTIGQRGLEADETHHGSCGLHPGDDNYIAKHTIFPTPFDKQDSMTVDDEGTMTEGTHGESASTHRTTSSEQFVSSRPSTLPRQTTENITKHTVFPEGETMVPISQKARTMHEQPSTSVSHHLHKVDESPAPSDSQKVTTTEAISSAIEMPIESMKHELPTTSVSHHMHHATSPSLPSVTTGVASTAVDPVTKGLTKSQKKKLAKKKNKNKNKGAYDFEDTVEKMASEKSQMEAKGGVQGTHNLGVREQHTTQHTKEVNPHNTAMNWSEVAQYGDLEDKVEHGQVKLL